VIGERLEENVVLRLATEHRRGAHRSADGLLATSVTNVLQSRADQSVFRITG
jgi:hypothetical protein